MELATSLSWQNSLLIGTGFTSALAFSISVWLIFKHLLHYNQPSIQKHIVRIIIMIPVRLSPSTCFPPSLLRRHWSFQRDPFWNGLEEEIEDWWRWRNVPVCFFQRTWLFAHHTAA